MNSPTTPRQAPALVVLRVEQARVAGPPHVVEVGAIRVVEGEVADHFHRLVRPLVPIDADATAQHGIGNEAVRGAATAPEVLSEFFEWFGDAWWAAHGAERDAHALAFESARHGLSTPDGPVLDTRALARKLVRGAFDHELETLVDHLELEPLASHGELGEALARAVAAWQVLEACSDLLAESGPVDAGRLLDAAGARRTIACYAPERPVLRGPHVHRLDRARAQGSAVILHYGGGDERSLQPPTRLQVLPGQTYRQHDHAYLEGECLRTGTLKTYRLDRILRVEPVA